MRARRHRAVAGRSTAVWLSAFLFLSGSLLVTHLVASAAAQEAPPERTSPADPYAGFIAEAARRYGIPEIWIRAVMRVESGGNIRAISPKGAMGLMQIMPATWTELRARHGLGGDPYDPRDNIFAGAAYLREMHDRYGSPGFLAAYNAGPGRYEEYRDNGRPLPAETRAYLSRLAPIISGRALASPVTVATDDPLGWTRAPLFVARSEGDERAEPQQTDRAPAAPASSDSERDPVRSGPKSGAVFVARGAGTGPR